MFDFGFAIGIIVGISMVLIIQRVMRGDEESATIAAMRFWRERALQWYDECHRMEERYLHEVDKRLFGETDE